VLAIDHFTAALPSQLHSYYMVSNANTLWSQHRVKFHENLIFAYSAIPYSVFYKLPTGSNRKSTVAACLAGGSQPETFQLLPETFKFRAVMVTVIVVLEFSFFTVKMFSP